MRHILSGSNTTLFALTEMPPAKTAADRPKDGRPRRAGRRTSSILTGQGKRPIAEHQMTDRSAEPEPPT